MIWIFYLFQLTWDVRTLRFGLRMLWKALRFSNLVLLMVDWLLAEFLFRFFPVLLKIYSNFVILLRVLDNQLFLRVLRHSVDITISALYYSGSRRGATDVAELSYREYSFNWLDTVVSMSKRQLPCHYTVD